MVGGNGVPLVSARKPVRAARARGRPALAGQLLQVRRPLVPPALGELVTHRRGAELPPARLLRGVRVRRRLPYRGLNSAAAGTACLARPAPAYDTWSSKPPDCSNIATVIGCRPA